MNMVWRQKGKRGFYGKLPTRTGWRNVWLGSPDRPTAEAVQRLLLELGHQRRWALLEAIPERFTAGEVYDAHQRNDLAGLLERLNDVDLAPRVVEWQRAIRAAGTVREETAAQYLAKVRTLILPDVPFLASEATPERMDRWLSGLTVASPTRRRYFAAGQSFFGYLVRLKVLPASPLRDLARPKDGEPRADWWLTHADMLRVVGAAHEPYRSLFALLYGTGIEVSVGCVLTRKNVDMKRREIFAPGTKNHNRKRTVRVSEWAWEYVESLCAGKTPEARLFPRMKRGAARYQHDQVVKRIGLDGYQLRDSRHSWAVRAAKAGTPPELIARQLGHKDAVMVLRVYGRFFPSSEERDKWEQIAALQDAAQVAEMGSAATLAATSLRSASASRDAGGTSEDAHGILRAEHPPLPQRLSRPLPDKMGTARSHAEPNAPESATPDATSGGSR